VDCHNHQRHAEDDEARSPPPPRRVEDLTLVDQLRADGALDGYNLPHSVRGHLLSRLDRHSEAHAELELAASLAANAQERNLSAERAAASAAQAGLTNN